MPERKEMMRVIGRWMMVVVFLVVELEVGLGLVVVELVMAAVTYLTAFV